MEREWNRKLATANTNNKKILEDTEKKIKSVQEEAQRKYNELKKAEAEKLSKVIQMARRDALKKAEDGAEKSKKRGK